MTLAALQRDFRGWLTNMPAAEMGRWIESTDAQAAGLAVYHNAYRVQLVDCMRETFEKTLLWLGDDAFIAAARRHIESNPPRGWTLGVYGEGFGQTLAALYPADPEVAELARLDRALARAFEGPDAEPLDPELLTPGSPTAIDWDKASLVLLPTVQMIPATTNAGAIWSALAAETQPPAAALLPGPAAMLVWREGFTPCFRTIEADEHAALTLIAGGATFGDLCSELVGRLGEEAGIGQAGAFLGQWIGDRLIASIGYPETASCA